MFRTTQAFIDRLESDGLKYKLLGKTHGGDEAVSLVFDGDEDAAELSSPLRSLSRKPVAAFSGGALRSIAAIWVVGG